MSLAMFGTANKASLEASAQDKALMDVLDRRVDIPALQSLIEALDPETSSVPLAETAICLDSSVFLRIAKIDDVVDYLNAKHSAPLILPGQAIQEFWNNQLQAVATVSNKLQAKFDNFKNEFGKLDSHFDTFAVSISDQLEDFSKEHGNVYDQATVKKTQNLLSVVQERALIPFVPRSIYDPIAEQRNKSKTPPGFHDVGNGDFYIWADLLSGLQMAKENKVPFSRVVLATEDRKGDWSRDGVAHPILAAEVAALLHVPFEIWNIDQLSKEVAAAP